jgi:hypothetical protein
VARLNILLGEVAESTEIVRRRDGHWSLVPGEPARASLDRTVAALAARELTELVTPPSARFVVKEQAPGGG